MKCVSVESIPLLVTQESWIFPSRDVVPNDSLKELETEDINVRASEQENGRPDAPPPNSELFGNHVME